MYQILFISPLKGFGDIGSTHEKFISSIFFHTNLAVCSAKYSFEQAMESG